MGTREDQKRKALLGKVKAWASRPHGESYIGKNLTIGSYTDTEGKFRQRDFFRDRTMIRDRARLHQQFSKKASRYGEDEAWVNRRTEATLKKLTEWRDSQSAPLNTKISIGKGQSKREYKSAGSAIRDRRDRVLTAPHLDNLKNSDGETSVSLNELLKKRSDTINRFRNFTDPKNGYIGSSLSQVREEGYAAHLRDRKLKEAEGQRAIQDKLGNGKAITSTPGLVAYDLYGKPVAPVDPLKNFHGTMSNKERSALSQQHLVARAAYRTALSQWNKENPNLIGRDLASLDRVTYAMSAENRAREAIALGNQKVLQGMTSELHRQNKAIDSANFLASRGYTYNDKSRQWEKANG